MLLTARLGWSQGATTAAMSGVITDTKGEGLPGATVIATHTPTNTQYVAPPIPTAASTSRTCGWAGLTPSK